MSAAKRKLLVVGLGSIGQRHVRNLRALCGDELELSAFRVRKDARVLGDNMGVASESGLEETYKIHSHATLESALDARPDAVLVCNPSGLHLEILRAAAARGIDFFVEKPLSDRLDGLDELAAEVERKELVALVGFQMRFHPCFRLAQELLEARAIGRVLSARLMIGEWLPGFHPWEDYREGYAARRDLGGGVVLTLIHELDAALALFGMPRTVFALGGQQSSLALDVDDTASSLLDCAIEGKRVAVHVQQDFLQRPGRRTWEIIGDAGRIEIDLNAASLRHVGADGASTVRGFEGLLRNQLFLDEMKHFLACLDRREKPVVSLRSAIDSQRIAAAIQESMASGRKIDLR